MAYASPRRFVAYGSTIKPHLLSHPRRVRLDGLSKEERIEASFLAASGINLHL